MEEKEGAVLDTRDRKAPAGLWHFCSSVCSHHNPGKWQEGDDSQSCFGDEEVEAGSAQGEDTRLGVNLVPPDSRAHA